MQILTEYVGQDRVDVTSDGYYTDDFGRRPQYYYRVWSQSSGTVDQGNDIRGPVGAEHNLSNAMEALLGFLLWYAETSDDDIPEKVKEWARENQGELSLLSAYYDETGDNEEG